MAYAFPKALRLIKAADFKQILQQADKFKVKRIAVFVAANRLAYPRLGVIISKKSAPRAVQRNRFKRVVRESFRLHQQLLSGNDVVVIGYKGVAEVANEEIGQWLENLWQKATTLLER